MKTSARIFLLLTGIIALSYYLPAGWSLVTSQRNRPAQVYFSSTEKRFLFSRAADGGIQYYDTDGRRLDRDTFERLLPLTHWAQVSRDGRMPAEIDGTRVTIEAVRRAQFSLRLTPGDIDTPLVRLFPLLDAGGARARLEMPPDLLRLGSVAEFLDPKTNALIADKSHRFTAAFEAAGFRFPAVLSASNPTHRKPYDEGAYVVDSTGQLFRLRMLDGAPEVRRVADLSPPADAGRWSSLRVRHLLVQETDSRELRFLAVGADGTLSLAVGPDYRFVPLPLEHYDPVISEVSLRANLIHRLLVIRTGDRIEAVVFDRNYTVVDRYEEVVQSPANTGLAGRISRIVFPFSWKLTDGNSGFLGFHVESGSAWAPLFSLSIFTLWAFWLTRRKGAPLRRHWLEAAAIVSSGLFGLLVALAAPKAD